MIELEVAGTATAPSLTALTPGRVREMTGPELDALAVDLRRFLVASVSRTGGHLGANLGVVELTIALHRVLDSPRDALVWDTGHQAYVHKILTGRADRFATLRQGGGLSGYPNRAESEHDLVENSHASTALSYAAGLAAARRTGSMWGFPAHGVRQHQHSRGDQRARRHQPQQRRAGRRASRRHHPGPRAEREQARAEG